MDLAPMKNAPEEEPSVRVTPLDPNEAGTAGARRSVIAARFVVVSVIVLAAAACSGGGSSAAKKPQLGPTTTAARPSTSTTPRTPATVTPTTLPKSGPVASLLAAISTYEQTTGGLRPGSYQIVRASISSVDHTYAFFSIGPVPGGQSIQGGHGFARNDAGNWTVIDFGTAGVGCSSGSKRVPDAVLAEFALSCPH
jgi:hypothetical protein